MIGCLPATLRARLRRWIAGPYDYRRAYRLVDLERDYWSIVGPSTEEEFFRLGLGKLQMLRDLGLGPDAHLLDVGCGTGQLATALEPFLSPAGAYVGTDIAPEAIAFCRRKFQRPNFQFVESEMTGVPLSGRRFDFVYFGSVFTHMYTPEIRAMLEAPADRRGAPAAQGGANELLVAVPPGYTREQLGLLVGIANECGSASRSV